MKVIAGRSMGVLVAALVALTVAITSGAAEPRIGKFVKYDTGDFVIVTSRSASQAKQFMQGLVKFRLTLERILGKRAAKSGIGTHIIIVGEADWKKYLQPREQIAGFFQRARFNNYMTLNGDVGDYALYVMFHEYAHFYLASQFAGEYPPWFNEGLAELMAYSRFDKNNRVVLLVPTFHVQEARDRDWIPFERLLKVDHTSPEYQSHKQAGSFYAQSWLTVHYGMVEDREFGRQFMSYLRLLNTLTPQPEAARMSFGEDLGVIDQKLRAYARSSVPSGGLDLGEIPEVTLPTAQPLTQEEGLEALIDAMLSARLAPSRIRPLVESLKRRAPGVARSHVLDARLAAFEGDTKAFEAAVDMAGQKLGADDWLARRELGNVLLSNAIDSGVMADRSSEDDERDLKRAAKRYSEAIVLNSDDAQILWGLGTALTRLDRDLDMAETALKAAYVRVPASAAVALSLANLKGRQQKPDEMIPYLKDTIRYAEQISMRQWATSTLEEMQRFIAERDRIDAENRKQQEAYEKQLAEYEKKYGKRKKAK